MTAARDETPAVARQRVRRALRKARRAAALTQSDVSTALRWSLSKVQRIESGEVGISVTDLRALLDVYSVVDEALIEALIHDAVISRRQRWLVTSEHREHLTPGLRQLLQFEAQATVIRAYQPFIFPGVLQTPAMAEHLLGWFDKSLSEQDRKVRFDVRMLRARRITQQEDAPTYLLMLDEAALRREIGGKAVMADQLEAAAAAAARTNIHIRIVRLAEGATVGMLGAFTVLDLSDDEDDVVLYREFYSTDQVIHDAETVSSFRARFESMWSRCYSRQDSLGLIRAEAASLRASLIRGP
ncbi:helix-turn-helix domain-containing protein [Actinoplanes friuliensis]|uniref:Putative DNA-binding protein n=1 Tax=Actinoplanes friuliensis DSM 7358 TaxID=1246995 RepID=U5W306_9ACTN|nr:helix-turn-helix transcriptional regulator [Actinoplanes friuliensis]AGZ43578.1 putative DNA-binding protein [Actinoplanes friuliensis DSM 7358]